MKIFDFIGKLRKNGSDVLAKTDVVDNTTSTDTDLPLSANQGKVLKDGLGTKVNSATFSAHTGNTSNPHSVTKDQVGLGNVDNTADADKPISSAVASALATKADNSALADKADIDGSYENLTAGNAEQLVSSIGTTDKVPYIFRKSGGGIEVGDKENNTLVGGTIAWNQLVQNGDFADASNWVADAGVVLSISSNVGKVTAIATITQAIKMSSLQNIPTGHKVFGCLTVKAQTSGHYFGMSLNDTTLNKNTIVSSATQMPTSWGTFAGITEIADEVGSRIAITNASAMSVNDYFEIKNVQVIDLTQAFGSTIADYIYSLEQGEAGAGVSWFRNLFPKEYYDYNAGTLISVNASSHNTVGFNLFDNESGTAKVVGGKVHQITGTYTALSLNGTTITPDASGYFTPAESGELTVTGGNATDTCVHLKGNGKRDGEYEAYTAHEYPLDSSLTLRGKLQLDADNKLYCDGDTYESDGTVTRNYLYRSYESGDESLSDAITDGTNTVVKLATPTTETAEPFTNPQVVDKWGTEEYVVTEQSGVAVPVGHTTFYPVDLKSKLEDAPNNPSEDGDYIVRQANGVNTYFQLPALPSASGTYTFKATVSGSNVTLSWEA